MRALPPLAAVLALFLAPGPALGFPNEPDGFEDVSWGTDAFGVLRKRPGLRRNGYTVSQLRNGLRRTDGGIFMEEVLPLYSFEEASVQWTVGKVGGLYAVEVSLEDLSPHAGAQAAEVVQLLTERHGPPSTDPEGRQVWKGTRTVIQMEEPAVMSGVHVLLRYFRPSSWEVVELTPPPGSAPAAAPPAAAPAAAAPPAAAPAAAVPPAPASPAPPARAASSDASKPPLPSSPQATDQAPASDGTTAPAGTAAHDPEDLFAGETPEQLLDPNRP